MASPFSQTAENLVVVAPLSVPMNIFRFMFVRQVADDTGKGKNKNPR
jgi:hypothetical protein